MHCLCCLRLVLFLPFVVLHRVLANLIVFSNLLSLVLCKLFDFCFEFGNLIFEFEISKILVSENCKKLLKIAKHSEIW